MDDDPYQPVILTLSTSYVHWLQFFFFSDLQAATMQQKIKEQEQEVQIVERKQQIEIAEQEIQRKERELDSKVGLFANET